MHDRTALEIDTANMSARGQVAFDDFFDGAGCFGNAEMDCYEARLAEWDHSVAQDGFQAWSALLTKEHECYDLVEGVVVDPFRVAFVLINTGNDTFALAGRLYQ